MRFIAAIFFCLVLAVHGAALAAAADETAKQSGDALYRQYCEPCHGTKLTGYAADNAPSLVTPTFRETASDAFLRSAIARGRAGTAMGGYGQPFGGPLTAAQIDELIAFLRGGTKPAPLPSRPSRGSAAKGEKVYETNCQTCHGTSFQRGTAVHLANPMFLDTASDAYLRAAVVRGRAGTPMQAWQDKLSPQEIEDVVAYVRSLARPVPPPPAVARPGGTPSLPKVPIVMNPKGEAAQLELKDGRYVSAAAVAKACAEKRRLVIVDARSPADYLRLHIDGAISIPHFDMHGIDEVPNDGTWVVSYCACPHHVSEIVMDEFRKRGYAHTAVLDEGVFGWQQQGYPIIAAPGQLPIAAPPEEAPPAKPE